MALVTTAMALALDTVQLELTLPTVERDVPSHGAMPRIPSRNVPVNLPTRRHRRHHHPRRRRRHHHGPHHRRRRHHGLRHHQQALTSVAVGIFQISSNMRMTIRVRTSFATTHRSFAILLLTMAIATILQDFVQLGRMPEIVHQDVALPPIATAIRVHARRGPVLDDVSQRRRDATFATSVTISKPTQTTKQRWTRWMRWIRPTVATRTTFG